MVHSNDFRPLNEVLDAVRVDTLALICRTSPEVNALTTFISDAGSDGCEHSYDIDPIRDTGESVWDGGHDLVSISERELDSFRSQPLDVANRLQQLDASKMQAAGGDPG